MQNNIEEDKTVAVLSYITLIGWIVALVMHNGDNNTRLGAFHIRQSLGIMILGFGIMIVAIIFAFIPILGILVNLVLYLSLLGAWIYGLVMAIQGEQKPIPFVGEPIQKILEGVAK